MKNSTQLNSTQLNSTQLNSTQLNSTQLNSTQPTNPPTHPRSTVLPRSIPLRFNFWVPYRLLGTAICQLTNLQFTNSGEVFYTTTIFNEP